MANDTTDRASDYTYVGQSCVFCGKVLVTRDDVQQGSEGYTHAHCLREVYQGCRQEIYAAREAYGKALVGCGAAYDKVADALRDSGRRRELRAAFRARQAAGDAAQAEYQAELSRILLAYAEGVRVQAGVGV